MVLCCFQFLTVASSETIPAAKNKNINKNNPPHLIDLGAAPSVGILF